MTRTHLSDPDRITVTRAARAMCGRDARQITEAWEFVTCRDCRRLGEQQGAGPRQVGFAEALLDLAATIAGPRIEPAPALDPEIWHSMRCRRAVSRRAAEDCVGGLWPHAITRQAAEGQCRCAVCGAEQGNAQRIERWRGEQERRPHSHHEHPFGSPRAALEHLATWAPRGASSWLGPIIARGVETNRLGAEVQTTQHLDRDTLETRRVDQAVDVERACLLAFSSQQSRHGLRQRLCVGILLESVSDDGRPVEWWAEQTGLTERAIKSMLRHGMKRVKIELAAAGYIPEPREKDGLGGEVAARRAKIARGHP